MLKKLILICLACMGSLSAEVKILALSGSTREGSYNKILVKEAAEIAQKMGAQVKIVDLRDYAMPYYDADLEAKLGMPKSAKDLRRLMLESDGFIIASPEYNGSLSAILKNTLDWASRSKEGQPSRDAFKGKKVAIMSISPGPGGGARGLVHLRAVIENIGGEVVPIQVAVPSAQSAFNAQGALQNPEIKEQLKQEIQQLLSR